MAKVSNVTTTRAADILGECRKIAVDQLAAALKTTLGKIEDALFESANQADNATHQNLYLDAMGELAKKRGAFTTEFIRGFDQAFEQSLRASKDNELNDDDVDFSDPSELSLIDTTSMDEALAVTNFIENVNSRCREELFALERRMRLLLGKPELERDEIPLAPRVISSAFNHARASLHADFDVKLTIFKLFDRFTVPTLPTLYNTVNRHLIEQEILPIMSAGRSIPPSAGQSGVKTTPPYAAPEPECLNSCENTFAQLQSLSQARPGALSEIFHSGGICRSGALPNDPHAQLEAENQRYVSQLAPNPQHNASVTPAQNTPTPSHHIDTSKFVDTLTMLQFGDFSGLPEKSVSSVPTEQLKAHLQAGNINVLKSFSRNETIGPINQTDELTLDVVSILFDYVFDDPSIPDFMKALMGKLQIPVLKVALLDKELFSRKSHPARKLIDLLAKSSVGLTEAEAEAGFAQLARKIVHEIVENFIDDITIFESAIVRLDELLTDQQAEAEARAERATRSLNTKEQIIHAKFAVDEAFNERMRRSDIREFVRQFLQDYWRQLLIVSYIDYGPDSTQWQSQLATMDQLIWSVDGKQSAEEKKSLAANLPALIREIRAGMKTLDLDRKVCSRFLSMLASVHVVAVKNDHEISIAEQHLIKKREVVDEPLYNARSPREKQAYIQQNLERVLEEKQIDAQELELDPSLFDDNVPVEDVDAEVLPTIKNLNRYLDMATDMDLGDWIEIDETDGTTKRARFTWISPNTGRYLFTTQSGQKSMDTTLGKLAELFSNGSARRIATPADPLFDRALDDIMGRLASA